MALWIYTALSEPGSVCLTSDPDLIPEDCVAKKDLSDACSVLEAFSLYDDGMRELERFVDEIIEVASEEPEKTRLITAYRNTASGKEEVDYFIEAVKAICDEDAEKQATH